MSAVKSMMQIDDYLLQDVLACLVGDISAAASVALIDLGDRLGLYRAMAGQGSVTAREVADRAGCQERLVREWLDQQVVSGYVSYDPDDDAYELDLEEELTLAAETSPAFVVGAVNVVRSIWRDLDRLERAFRGETDLGWADHDPCLSSGMDRFFQPAYRNALVQSWIPALDGMDARLEAGARVVDIGAGQGTPTIVLAKAYPASTFVGVDSHPASVERARKAAAEAGVCDRVRFTERAAPEVEGGPYDLVCFFDALHDMGDPLGAILRAREVIATDGAVLLVEPNAGDAVTHSVGNPVRRLYYAASVAICLPSSLAQDVALGLGNQVGEERLRRLFGKGGFSRFRIAAETPFHLIYEARP